MPTKFNIDDLVYTNMLEYLHLQAKAESLGNSKDIAFITQDYWLQDTAVVENIQHRNGEWNICLVFAHHLTPLKFIKRKIVNCTSEKKAILTAYYMRRLAAKDQRGTLVINSSVFNTNFN